MSLISHGHGRMVVSLVRQLLNCQEVHRLVVTLNTPEKFPKIDDDRLEIIQNIVPKGFGANHNQAFNACEEAYFCVINPDIELIGNPFPQMILLLREIKVGIVAPLIIDSKGNVEDSMRMALTPWSLIKRICGIDNGAHQISRKNLSCSPDWVAGMFMLFKSEAFLEIDGFDERFFMYCEDADICTRLSTAKYRLLVCLSIAVTHHAQRASRRNLIHLWWHLKSIGLYLLTHYSK